MQHASSARLVRTHLLALLSVVALVSTLAVPSDPAVAQEAGGDTAASVEQRAAAQSQGRTRPGGPVMLTGIDPELGPGDCYHGCLDTWQNVLGGLVERGRGGGGGVLVLGANGGSVEQWWSNVVLGGGVLDDGEPFEESLNLDLEFVSDVEAIAALTFDDLQHYDLVGVPSSRFQVSSGGITEAQSAAINSLADEIAEFINSGGALLGHTQDRLAEPYDYISGFGEIEQSTSSSDILDITEAGIDAGIREDFEGCCWHTSFSSYPDFLEPLVFGAGGQVQVLGGRMVVVEGGVIDSIEVTQAIQEHQTLDELRDDGPTVPIIEGRDAALRIYPTQAPFPGSLIRFEVTGSAELSTSRYLSPGCSPERARTPGIQPLCDSVDVSFIPEETVEVTVEAYNIDDQLVDIASVRFDTVETLPIDVRPVAICDEQSGDAWECGDAWQMQSLIGFTQRTLPASVTLGRPSHPVTLDLSDFNPWWGLGVFGPDTNDWIAGVLDELEGRTPSGSFHYGLMRPELSDLGLLGVARMPGYGAMSLTDFSQVDNNDVFAHPSTTVAHELAHNLGRHHPPHDAGPDGCYATPSTPDHWPAGEWPYGGPPTIEEVGYDVVDMRPISSNRFDLLASCAPRWVSTYKFQRMISDRTPLPPSIPVGPVWLVDGVLDGDEAILKPVFEAERELVEPAEETEHQLVSLDADGNVLTEVGVQPSRLSAHGDVGSATMFTAVLPTDDEAVAISLRDGDGNEVASVEVDGDPPTIEITSPEEGDDLDAPGLAEWQASEDAVAYRVEYSHDDGDTWDQLSGYWTQTTFPLHPDHLAASTDTGASLLRVTASDGAVSTSAVSGGFTVGSTAPRVAITSPDDGHVTRSDDLVLRAAAIDTDEVLDDDALSWASDVDGPLGTGQRLAPGDLTSGEHQITVTATDSFGNSATDDITVLVDDDGPVLSVVLDGHDEALGQEAGETLLLHTASVTGSLETSLLVNGVDADRVQTDDFTEVDLDAYDTIFVGIDDGDVDADDLAALRAAVDGGARVIGFGGVADEAFVAGVDEHLFGVDTTATEWRQPDAPHFQLVEAGHPLVRDLPAEHEFAPGVEGGRDASSAVLTITDPDVTTVARDGDGHPSLITAEDDALIWFTSTPLSALWGDRDDAALLDQLVANVLDLQATVEGPVTFTIDADRNGGAPLDTVGYSLDGGQTLEDIDLSQLPYALEVEDGPVQLIAHAQDGAGNQAVETRRLFVEPADDAGDPPPTDDPPADVLPPGCDDVVDAPFPDVPADSPHAAAIECAVTLELVRGFADGTFGPQLHLTRAQAATVIARALRTSDVVLAPGTRSFDDVEGGPHADNIAALASMGIVEGHGQHRFEPSAPVTRAQLVTMIARAADSALPGLPEDPGTRPFTDIEGSPHTANIARAERAGIAEGRLDGRFHPSAPVRRDQAASLASRWLAWRAAQHRDAQ